nr:acyl-CoA dehydrogenase family protein [Parahaliea mediterranea]
MQLAACYIEPDSRYCLSRVTTKAVRDGGGYVISGKKCVVLNGGHAENYLVVARTSGDSNDQSGISCFIVPNGVSGLSVDNYRMNDGVPAADLVFTDVRVPESSVLGAIGDGFKALESVVARATFAACAESVGIMDELLNKTVEYTKTRKQFGVPISSFQALQHRMVDMFIACEQSRSMLLMAACELDQGSESSLKAVSATKARVGQAARLVGQEAVQIHGGIGITDELDISHYFKRLTSIENLFGSVDYHVGRYMSA